MKNLLTVFVLFFTLSTLSFGQSDEAYKETLKVMFDKSGSEGTYKAAMKQMFSMFKQQYQDIDASLWSEIEAEFNEAAMADLIELLVPVYQEHLSIDDLKGIIAFYDTPVGKKFATQTPKITEGAMQVGQQWGMQIAQTFTEKMKARGY